jgi:hypothetical protein
LSCRRGTGPAASPVRRDAAREAERSGAALGQPRWDDDRYAEKLDLVCAERVPSRLVHLRVPFEGRAGEVRHKRILKASSFRGSGRGEWRTLGVSPPANPCSRIPPRSGL